MRTVMSMMGALFFALLSFTSPCYANEALQEGKKLFMTGENEEAYLVLEEAFLKTPENLDISFIMGRAAFELGNYEKAVACFERILAIEPNAPRVKLELARTYLKLGATEVAKGLFHDVLETNPPAVVQQNIQFFLAGIDKYKRRHFLSGLIETGVLYDDNVGTFPNDDSLIVAGLPVHLEGEREGDIALQLSAALRHLYRIGQSRYSWRTTGSVFNRFHNEIDDEDINYLAVATGLARQTDQSSWAMTANVGQLYRGSASYLKIAGVTVDYMKNIRTDIDLYLSVSVQDKNYTKIDLHDSDNISASISPVINKGKNRLGLTVGLEHENAKANYYDYDKTVFGLKYQLIFKNDLRLNTSFTYHKTEYDKKMPLFAKKRKDDVNTFEIKLSKTLWRSKDRKKSLGANISYNYSTSKSNISLYEYDKHVNMASLVTNF